MITVRRLDENEPTGLGGLIGALVWRALVSAIFIWSGFDRLLDPAGTANAFAGFGILLPELGCFAAAVMQIVGGLALLFGIQSRLIAIIERTDWPP
jgi:putative oxidoreductase